MHTLGTHSGAGGHDGKRGLGNSVPPQGGGFSEPGRAPEEASFPFQLAICGAPMFGDLDPHAVLNFVEYHYVVAGADQVVLYDAGAVTKPMLGMLQDYIAHGVVTVTDFREAGTFDVGPGPRYADSYSHNHYHIRSHCHCRSHNNGHTVYTHIHKTVIVL